ncbi:nectin-3-like protein [Carassius auratus]|uniref:Nectin cell adhesion molecule 3 n=1 Tax=Carassius auratus TaxID=7957 RepID=A0A6P6LEN8_CARAU|nr:nectin-3-like protein [Carassius auratus]
MAEEVRHIFGNSTFFHGLLPFIGLLLSVCTGVWANRVVVPEQVTAVLGKNVTLTCRVEVSTNLSLTQSSWERRLPSGTTTLAVFNPQYGTSISDEYSKRVHFINPSVHDASIVLQGMGFADIGTYTCKAVTFQLGNMQASTTVDIMVEPKVYLSPGPLSLLDGRGQTLVATCTAERARPAAEVFWDSDLPGQQSAVVTQQEPEGTTTSSVHYVWAPTRDAFGRSLSCVVRHPALSKDFHIPYRLNVFFVPEVMVIGRQDVWYVGQKDVQLDCRASANPPALLFLWTRLDAPMPAGLDTSNGSLLFTRPLEPSDSGQYRCEVQNDVGRSFKDVRFLVQEPPPTTAATSTSSSSSTSSSTSTSTSSSSKSILPDTSSTITAPINQHAHFTAPTRSSPPDSGLGTILGGAVGGILILVLLMALVGAFYMRQRRTFRGDYYTKQYIGPSDMQKESQMDVLQPHELQDVYGDDSGNGSQDLKPIPEGDIIYPDYSNDHKDMEGWEDNLSLQRESSYYSDQHNHHNVNPSGPPLHNGSPYLQDECYDNGTDSDYVSHVDGSVISRREWYV